jgi:hypothetical protein
MYNKLVCTAYISTITGAAINSVGKMPPIQTEPYSWTMPLLIFMMLAAAASLGYGAGKEDAAKDNKD